MQENTGTPSGSDSTENKPLVNPEEDGRNKEWQDRARVNLEQVPEGTPTNVERDFEPENPEGKKEDAAKDGSQY